MDKLGYFTFLAPLILFWQQGRNFFGQIFSLFIRNDELHIFSKNSFISYLSDNKDLKEIKFGNLIYKNHNTYVLKYKSYLDCFFIFKNKYIYLYKRFIPVLINVSSEKIKVTYFNLFNFQDIIIKYLSFHHQYELRFREESKSFWIGEIEGRSIKETGLMPVSTRTEPGNSPAPLNAGVDGVNFLYLEATPPVGFALNEIAACQPETKKSKYYFSKEGLKVFEIVKTWLDAKDWYTDRQINWRRGCLLYGEPGTGKSELILQIAKKLKIGINIIKLATLDDKELSDKTSYLCSGSIILIEDIDNVYNLRENKYPTSVSFDNLLNKISGVNCWKNCFLFITTNHIEKLDDALLRAGRLDDIIELPTLCKEGKAFIASKMLDEWPELQEEIVNQSGDVTAAAYENLCASKALEMFWKNK